MISLINAGPGTGKTFSLIYSYLLLSQKILGRVEPTEEQQAIFDYVKEEFPRTAKVCFFAHSNSVKEKLIASLGKNGPAVYTFHGAGQSSIIKRFNGFQRPVSFRVERHIEQMIGCPISELTWEEKKEWYEIKRIINYLKVEALEPTEDSLVYLKGKYPDLGHIPTPDTWIESCEWLLDKASRPDGMVDYADQLWLGKKCVRKPIYDLGLVDESQDVSRASYELVTRLCRNVLFCGDKNQAINAFAGASEEMYDSIAGKSDAIWPLKVTQRCPPIICDRANKTRPGGIVVGPNKMEGVIETKDRSSLPGMLVGKVNPTNCLFVARTNATVIGMAIFFHNKGLPYQIIDKDLSKEILSFIKSFKTKSLSALVNKLAMWRDRMARANNKMWVAMSLDKYEMVMSILKECSTYDDIDRFVKDAFETHKQGFKLTTIHKAKGLEAQNIFILNPPIPLPAAMEHPIGREQEINLKFVAETRSALNLYEVI